MDPSSQALHPLATGSQTVWYSPWLKVSVALRYVLTFPWAPEAWREAYGLPDSRSGTVGSSPGRDWRRGAGQPGRAPGAPC